MDEITLKLDSPITEEQWDAIMDVDLENTPRIMFHTKNGQEVWYEKVGTSWRGRRLFDCKVYMLCLRCLQRQLDWGNKLLHELRCEDGGVMMGWVKISDYLCDYCESQDCLRCVWGNPCLGCDDYDPQTQTCMSDGGCAASNEKEEE